MGAKIRGVNLGNWLVLEKWMGGDVFLGTSAEDEERLYEVLDHDELAERLERHRSSYITEDDFARIASLGLNAVRIPVPYSLFGAAGHVACVDHLDQAFVWAKRHGLQVLVDLHTVPGSQNGFDNGGLSGIVSWHHASERVSEAVELLGAIAERYAARPALWGIELLNEPVSWPLREVNRKKYASPGRVQPSGGADYVPTAVLRDFYRRGYEAVREHTQSAKVVIHDGFRLRTWENFMANEAHDLVIDTHQYVGFRPSLPWGRSMEGYERMLGGVGHKLERASRHHEVVVGEWCLANKARELVGASEEERRRVYRTMAELQMKTWERCAGWFFWNWKLMVDNRQDWDLSRAVELGWVDCKP